jgi:hypothetical protein
MAKSPMICPFSKTLCRECSFYIGRHYYLCFCKDYRGHLGNQTEEKSNNFSSNSTEDKDKMCE